MTLFFVIVATLATLLISGILIQESEKKQKKEIEDEKLKQEHYRIPSMDSFIRYVKSCVDANKDVIKSISDINYDYDTERDYFIIDNCAYFTLYSFKPSIEEADILKKCITEYAQPYIEANKKAFEEEAKAFEEEVRAILFPANEEVSQ